MNSNSVCLSPGLKPPSLIFCRAMYVDYKLRRNGRSMNSDIVRWLEVVIIKLLT